MTGLRAIACAAALGLAALFSSAALAEDVVSADDITTVLESEGYAVQQIGPSMVGVVVGSQVILVGVDSSEGDVTYVTYLPDLSLRELGYEFLNQFNTQIKFGRAYVDGDGDIAIQMDRNATGGISTDNVLSDFDVFLMLVSKFLQDVATGTIA
ncbi:MAG: YbjN domain-containing protein [Pseudomonadota bacterium]